MRLKYDPYGIVIDQTTLCNQKCSFCHRSLNHQDILFSSGLNQVLSFDQYAKIIDEASLVDSVRWLSLCGPMGEPLLVTDLAYRMEYAMSKDHFETVLINSNGQAIDLHDPVRLLQSCTDLQFSVDSIREQTYCKIHCGGNLAKVIQNIRNLNDVKQRIVGRSAAIRIRFTENEHNLDEWEEFEHFFKPISNEVFRVKVHSFMGRLQQYNSHLGATICNQPFRLINFNVRGEITTCCINWMLEPTFGSITDFSLKELWESNAIESWRATRMNNTCKLCGGLGTFQQRIDNVPSPQEMLMASTIEQLGENRYYDELSMANNSDDHIMKKIVLRFVSNLKRRLHF